MRVFVLGPTVHANVAALRAYLGSATRPLSLADFARLLNERDGRARAATTVQSWERGTEPDLHSIRLMAQLAGVSFEEFALGTREKARTAPASAFKRASSQEEEAKRRPARKKGA